MLCSGLMGLVEQEAFCDLCSCVALLLAILHKVESEFLFFISTTNSLRLNAIVRKLAAFFMPKL